MSTEPVDAERVAAIAGLVAKYKMALNNKKRRTLMGMNDKAFHSYELGLIVSRCCRDMDLEGAYAAYLNAKSVDVAPGAETFCNLLSLTAGLGVQGSGQAMVRVEEPPHNLDAALIIYEDMLRCEVAVPEASYTALIRCCCINQQPYRGLQFFREMQRLNITPKLRSFTSLLDALSTHSDTAQSKLDVAAPAENANHIECGFGIYNEMIHKYELDPTEKEFVCMLRLCLSGADLRFHTILTAFADSGIVPVSSELRDVLTQWFTSVEPSYIITSSAVQRDGTVELNQERLRSLDVDERFRADFLEQLRSFALVVDDNRKIKVNNKIKEQQQIQALKQQLRLSAAADAGLQSSSTSNSIATDTANSSATTNAADTKAAHSYPPSAPMNREELWGDFVKYLRYHRKPSPVARAVAGTVTDMGAVGMHSPTKRPRSADSNAKNSDTQDSATTAGTSTSASAGFDIIVDGANVGYFKQNYQGAPQHVDYHQIDQLLQHLRSIGHSPLLILHCRHVSKYMIPNAECDSIVRRWRADGCIYATPKGFNDDWFWLYAAVSTGCKAVTNDEMRDHHFQLLSPKWFNRWRERNRVQFTFGVWQDQQLKQQQKSVISGSSNSFSNSATLRALRHMPVNLTTDAEPANTNSSAEGSAEGEGEASGDSSDGDSSEDDFVSEQTKAPKAKSAPRRVSLRWPCPYSYSLQHIVGIRYEGYYCPPLPDSEVVPDKSAQDAGIFGVPGDSSGNKWMCIYKERTDAAGESAKKRQCVK